MRNRLIYICSPLRGDIEKNIQKAQGYCREAVEFWPDVIPIAPHVYCTQFLDDTIPQEREAGMELGIALLDMCDELWVYGIDNPSEGMKKEIDYAKEHGIPVKSAADVYQFRKADDCEENSNLGNVRMKIPSFSGFASGAVTFTLDMFIEGNLIARLADSLKRNLGEDVTVRPEQ